MELKYFVVKEEVQKQRMPIEHISTNLMITDPLTKGLPPMTFIEHVENMRTLLLLMIIKCNLPYVFLMTL